MDMLLDLWVNTVYRDPQVEGSFAAPVAYFRNCTGSPLVSYADLARRWGVSKATVGRIMLKLSRDGYISLMTFPGRLGTAISPRRYLSTIVSAPGSGGQSGGAGKGITYPCGGDRRRRKCPKYLVCPQPGPYRIRS